MKKTEIKDILRENTIGLEEAGNNTRVKSAVQAKDSEQSRKENTDDKVTKLLANDIINHAAVVRNMTGEEWTGNSEATNRSKFRKKLKRMTNDEGGTYSFNEDEVGQIEKILMSLSSTISHTIGRQGK